MMRAAVVPVACALLLLAGRPLPAQQVRVTGSASLRYIDIRPLVRDSVAAADAGDGGLLRQLKDGRVVRCIPGEAYCHDTRAGRRVSTIPLIQDVEASAWGLGRGVHLFAHMRGRTGWGGDPRLWPRSDDAIEVLAAYAELDRERLRVRAGRQWRVSGLGFYNFDGIAVAVRSGATAWLEAFAGRSLMRGLHEPRTSGALESIESLAPPAAGLLLGLQARYRPLPRLALGATYQVDFRDDGAGLYAEVAAADGVLRLGAGSIEGALEVDVATGLLNEGRLRIRAPPVHAAALHAEVRHYRPYFELWTIWGAFSPVGFDEARAGVAWAGARGIVVRGDASYRSYRGAGAGITAARDDGWGLGVGGSWAPAEAWRGEAALRIEAGAGAARRDAHAAVTRRFGDAGSITVVGLGAEAAFRLTDRSAVRGGFAAYQHLEAGPAPGPDWTQRRASLRIEWTVGAEPGTAGGGAP
jgi:hypothetical protein